MEAFKQIPGLFNNVPKGFPGKQLQIAFAAKPISPKILLIIISGLLIQQVAGQSANMEYSRVTVGDAKNMLCGIDLSPDNSYLAVSSTQSFPFFIFDWNSRQVIRQFTVGNWYAGSSVKHSNDGQYILLQQLFYIDFALNKDREVNFEIIRASDGQVIKRFDAYHAVAITPDSRYAVSLTAEDVEFWELPSGNKAKSFRVDQATNGLAISPDGQYIAVSHKPDENSLKQISRLRDDKKAIKAAMQYNQQITVYRMDDFTPVYTIQELYDIVYRLEYSPDGGILFCMQIPHVKAQASDARQTYISTINGKTGEPMRKGFTSQAFYEPDFKLSQDGKLFGIVSKGAKFLELHLYDFETGRMLHRFEQSFRLFEKTEGGMTAADSRMSFVFLPDNETVVMTMGNHLIYWKPKQ